MSSVGGAGISTALYAAVSNPAQLAAQPDEAKEKAHHLKNGKGFMNPWDSYTELTLFQFMKTTLGRKFSGQQNKPDSTNVSIPILKPSFSSSRSSTAKLRATWLGHACFYVEYPSGLRVLFDPVFEDCCAPINLKFLRRFTPPPCEIEALPYVDLVVISHNHYDHLSYPTIKRIAAKFENVHFFAPLGNKKWFTSCGIAAEQVTELDWWETRDITLSPSRGKKGAVSVKSLGSDDEGERKTEEGTITATIGALPCQHVSARTPFDKCKTLWASWSVFSSQSSTQTSSVYFAGDTGYRAVPILPAGTDDYAPEYSHLPVCPTFAQIGKLRGPFDLGLIPIGAYEPRFMWSPVHANPKDAVNILVDTKCKMGLGMHWGTWVLTEEEVEQPPRMLEEACRWKGIEEGRFEACGVGESREFDKEVESLRKL